MKSFKITILISAIILMGVWIFPEMGRQYSKEEGINEISEEFLSFDEDGDGIPDSKDPNPDSPDPGFWKEKIVNSDGDTILYIMTYEYPDSAHAEEGPVAEIYDKIIIYTNPDNVEEKKEINWQALITWIIGSLNGLFGLVLMIKKIFSKS